MIVNSQRRFDRKMRQAERVCEIVEAFFEYAHRKRSIVQAAKVFMAGER